MPVVGPILDLKLSKFSVISAKRFTFGRSASYLKEMSKKIYEKTPPICYLEVVTYLNLHCAYAKAGFEGIDY